MQEAGYDPARDTWAVNEVGEPTMQAMGVDVIKGAPNARRNLLDFIRGLYEGDGTPMPGLVFAADPIQEATDLWQYKADLRSFYGDSEFWDELSLYVRFWAQEAYADVRAWGVAGTTLAERTAYLNDYFLHGLRVATVGGAETEAARAFFEDAYTPIGNAVYRSPPPPPGAITIAFGSTDVDLATMKNFVSTQTYALRSSAGARFGFADNSDRQPHAAGRRHRGRGPHGRRHSGLRERCERRLRHERRVVRRRCRRRGLHPASGGSSWI